MVTLLEGRIRHPEKAHRPDTEVLRKPDWIRVKAPGSPIYRETQQIVRDNNLVTVCEEAGCPNIGECWSKKHATMMIMGEVCTRACAFCNVKTGLPRIKRAGQPGFDDAEGAGAGTGITHDHEGRVPLVPALTDIGTACLLAHRVQPVRAYDLPGVAITPGYGRPHPDPIGLLQRRHVGALGFFRMARSVDGVEHDGHGISPAYLRTQDSRRKTSRLDLSPPHRREATELAS